MSRLRIAIAGMAIESSTFSPHRAGDRDFRRVTGDDLVERYQTCAATEDRVEWIGVHYARSIPGGAVEPDTYADVKDRILSGLRAVVADGPLDGVFLDLHGAMSVVGTDDAEGDLVAAIREVVGPEPMLSASMDLHGNVSEVLAREVDLLTCYRMAPHEDAWETKNRAARNLVQTLETGVTPVRAWVKVPILLPGEKTSTRVEPAKGLYARIPPIESLDGVIDAAIWIGYAWADEPRCHATVIVQGTDADVCADAARDLARQMWQVREEFSFVGPPGTLDEALMAAAASEAKPYLISDSGDNPGAGGTGDVTWTLGQLIERPDLVGADAPRVLVASVFDASALDQLREQEIGSTVEVEVGARTQPSPAPPVMLRGTLESLHHGDPDAGDIAVIAIGGIRAIITEHRKAYHSVDDFTAIGLDPAEADIVITKIGYLEPTLYELATRSGTTAWTLALTPGGVDQDLDRLGHHRITRPMFPFDAETRSGGEFSPDFDPVLLSRS